MKWGICAQCRRPMDAEGGHTCAVPASAPEALSEDERERLVDEFVKRFGGRYDGSVWDMSLNCDEMAEIMAALAAPSTPAASGRDEVLAAVVSMLEEFPDEIVSTKLLNALESARHDLEAESDEPRTGRGENFEEWKERFFLTNYAITPEDAWNAAIASVQPAADLDALDMTRLRNGDRRMLNPENQPVADALALAAPRTLKHANCDDCPSPMSCATFNSCHRAT